MANDLLRLGNPPTRGGFQNPGVHTQCTAMSKRSGERCKAPAVTGSRTQKCRMHGGNSTARQSGLANPNFSSGRHSAVLKEGSPIAELYEKARVNPDLLAMTDHLALLEARMQEVLGKAMDSPVPEWGEFVLAVGELEEAHVKGDTKGLQVAVTTLHRIVEGGQKWDTSWRQVVDLMDNIRKLADTEVKRKKDLGMMIPIERVMALMAAVGHSVKARVTNVEEVQAVFRDLARLHGSPSPEVAGYIEVENSDIEEVEETEETEIGE